MSRIWSRAFVLTCFFVLAAAFIAGEVLHEMRTSLRQAGLLVDEAGHYFHWIPVAGDEALRVEAPEGPLDQRRGYARIPDWEESLPERGFVATWRASVTPRMALAREHGVYPIYDVQPQAGLTILSDDGVVLHQHRSPDQIFDHFEELPELLVASLLFIENRELLEPGAYWRNPAVEWKRFLHAAFALVGRRLGLSSEHFGGSTLATQLEKFRHSPEGLTRTEKDKLDQMTTATLRAYQRGALTQPWQRQIVLDYVNGVPLSASPGFGEVHGMAQGLRVWFDADPGAVMADLERLQMPGLSAEIPMNREPVELLDQARSMRMVLSLLLAHRRPSYYLLEHSQELHQLTDAYARIMAAQGLISPVLRDAMLLVETPLRRAAAPPLRPDFAQRKALDSVRSSLLNTLELPTFYELDRVDVYAQSTIEARAQLEVDRILHSIHDPEAVKELGLTGHRLLRADAPLEELIVSFTLYEQTPRGSALRVLSDNHDQPLNINEHVMLDLGSTAKLRTLVTYLEVIAHLHDQLQGQTPQELRAHAHAPDRLRRWVASQLQASPELTLEELLERGMQRQYSASPNEVFFTGGGLHRFSNFEGRRNHTQSAEEAFRHSINLVFVRMMRDIADFYTWLDPERMEALFQRRDPDERRDLLKRFADMEGQEFQRQFYPRYASLSPHSIPDRVVSGRTLGPRSLALIYMAFPDPTVEGLQKFVERHGGSLSERDAVDWHHRYAPERLNWQDRGYLTRVHPLEIWTAAWLVQHPGASLDQTIVASREVRQEVYQWLLRTRAQGGQDNRIRQLLEIEAFEQIHLAWRRLGYPFPSLVPSLASSLGASADRPLALAELLGILLHEGQRWPEYRVEALIAAAETPYEVRFARAEVHPEQVLRPEVARVARAALIDVVEDGTARRILGTFTDIDGVPLVIGGKTGTGDHRHKTFRGLELIDSRPVHRTATFAFFLGDRFHGSLTVFVSGEAADEFRFTSALPATILRALEPALRDLLQRPSESALHPERPGIADPGSPLALLSRGASEALLQDALPQRWTPPPSIDEFPHLAGLHWRETLRRPLVPVETGPLRWRQLLEPERDEPETPRPLPEVAMLQ